MSKYKQTYIPSVTIQQRYNLPSYVKAYYSRYIQGKSVINKDIGLSVYFGSDGKNELAFGRAIYATKAAAVQCLLDLVRNAEYTHFKSRTDDDENNVLGFANFKAKLYIDGELYHAHIAVRIKTDKSTYLKAYYCHEINIIKPSAPKLG